jgi:hypothetical protein
MIGSIADVEGFEPGAFTGALADRAPCLKFHGGVGDGSAHNPTFSSLAASSACS